MNKDWHLHNRMPRNATLEQRVVWHMHHAENCGCRDIPRNLMNAITERKPARAQVEASGSSVDSRHIVREE